MVIPATKLLIPLSFASILAGLCTLIGTSTNLVVHGMALDEAAANPSLGLRGLNMFELGKIGLVIAAVGTVYIIIAAKYLLPARREERGDLEQENPNSKYFRVELVLGARFPAINKRIFDFDFKEKYGATLLELKRNGQTLLMHDMRKEHFREGDTVVVLADESFMRNWGDSSFFLLVALIKEWLRPGLILFSGAVVFLCAGILSPSEVVAGFSNKGMITVALLFLVSEGVRRSGLLEKMLYRLLPSKRCGERKALFSMMPVVSFISAFLNNTLVGVIFAPMMKR